MNDHSRVKCSEISGGRGCELDGNMVNSDRIDNLIAAVPPALALRAALDLGIFTVLAGGAMSTEGLAAALKIGPDRLSRLLYALASIELLEIKDGQFHNEPKPLLSSMRPSRPIAAVIMSCCASSGEPIS